MQKGAWSEWDKRPALEPHRVPHAEAVADGLFYTGSLGAGSWHISGGTVSPGICPGAAGAFSVYCPVCTCRETIGTFGAVAALAASHHTLRRNQSILDLEGTGSPGGGLLGLLWICQCAFGAHNGIRRAVYGPVSPYFRICRFSELVYSPCRGHSPCLLRCLMYC